MKNSQSIYIAENSETKQPFDKEINLGIMHGYNKPTLKKHCQFELKKVEIKQKSRDAVRLLRFYRTGWQSYLAANTCYSLTKGDDDTAGNLKIIKTATPIGGTGAELVSKGMCASVLLVARVTLPSSSGWGHPLWQPCSKWYHARSKGQGHPLEQVGFA